MTGPHCGSRVQPTNNSVPPVRIGATSTPSTRASAGAAAMMRSNAAPTAASPSRLSATPPMSLLCATSSEASFSTTRPPIARAAAIACTASVASVIGTTGILRWARKASVARSDRGRSAAGAISDRGAGAVASRRYCSDHQNALPNAFMP